MLARKTLPPEYAHWNSRHGAPFGRRPKGWRFWSRIVPDAVQTRIRGPFSVQRNNTTRAFEYPWAYHVAAPARGMRVLEVGGGLGGFQFVLARAGCEVTNVDPGLDAAGIGWPCDERSMRRLNAAFRTDVRLVNDTIANAGLAATAFERAFSLSVIEHLTPRERLDVMDRVFVALRPGGLFVLTIDLFPDLAPFTDASSNKYGTNADVRALVEAAPFELVVGERSELLGFPEFDAARIAASEDTYLVGRFPALVQCVVLRKPDA